MIEICNTCGRRKPDEHLRIGSARSATWCRDETHDETIAVTDNQARDLATAAKAYHAARELDDRAAALNDWLAVLTDGLPTQQTEQMELA